MWGRLLAGWAELVAGSWMWGSAHWPTEMIRDGLYVIEKGREEEKRKSLLKLLPSWHFWSRLQLAVFRGVFRWDLLLGVGCLYSWLETAHSTAEAVEAVCPAMINTKCHFRGSVFQLSLWLKKESVVSLCS